MNDQNVGIDTINLFTIDVEDYFMVSAFSDIIDVDQWGKYESRVTDNTLIILDLMEKYDVKATFFVLGWVAEHYPNIVKEIFRRKHEVACHSYAHRLIYNLSYKEFRDDTKIAKAVIEDVIGEKVYGYRAPSYSITKKSLWALDVLGEEGFLYDSSIFPIYHDRYGYPEFNRFPITIETNGIGKILEIPMSTIRILRQNIPVGGGGYLRLYPIKFTEWAIRNLNEVENKAAVVYIHPWELDPNQPRLNGKKSAIIRHYMNLGKTKDRVAFLLEKFKFGSVRRVYYQDIL